ncbi:MAG: MATE family efflux transporter [Xylophilus ampelinus]
MDARTRRLLEGPIAPTLLRLAWPNVLVMGAQAGAGLVETWFIGRLGTDALAGMALAFPVVMLMQMVSNGAMGGGIASAVARALGARRQAAADAVVRHALAIALAFGLAFAAAVLGGGRWLYGRMGGEGGSLAAALAYSDVVFAGAVLVWVFNALAAVLRGAGNMAVPAAVSCVGTLCLLPLSPLLIFGWGPLPGLGIAGGGWALLAYYAGGSAVLAAYLLAGRAPVRPRRGPLQAPLLRDILRVGLLGAVSTFATNLTIGFATAQVGAFGPAAIAGYGTAVRLEYLLVPLVFGLGAPLVAMVGACMGAGLHVRALQATWTGAALAMALSGAVGLGAALFPQAWLGLFASDPEMIAAGSRYLRAVGPFYAFFGLGLVLYFASQGAGRLAWPVAGNLARLAVAAGGGWTALRLGGGLGAVFAAQAAALAVYGLLNAGAVAGGAWFGRPGWPCGTAALMRRLART